MRAWTLRFVVLMYNWLHEEGTPYTPHNERSLMVLYWSQKLLDYLGRLEDWSHAALAQQPTNMISYPMDIGQHSEANPTFS